MQGNIEDFCLLISKATDSFKHKNDDNDHLLKTWFAETMDTKKNGEWECAMWSEYKVYMCEILKDK